MFRSDATFTTIAEDGAVWHTLGICTKRAEKMTNQLAIILGLIIVTALAIDAYSFNWDGTLFLARKLTDLIEWLAFWR